MFYELKDLVTSLAVITTILQFLSGILVCKQYFLNKTTAESSPLPYLGGVLSCGLWLFYGLYKNDGAIILVNSVGVTLMFSYLIIFYIYTIKKYTLLKQCVACSLCGILVLMYTAVEDDKEKLLGWLGFCACSLSLLTVAAPMSKLFYVLRVKNTECLPFPMILMSFFVSTIWMMYGLIENDPYIYKPNVIGATLAVFQLTLFVIFPSKPESLGLAKPILA